MDIQWDKLKTADGYATNFPLYIKALYSESNEARENAYWKIDNHAILQGDLYPSAYFIIESLVDIVKNCSYRREALNLLIEISLGYGLDSDVITVNGAQISVMDACRQKLTDLKYLLQGLIDNNAYSNDRDLLQQLVEIINDF